MKHLYLVEFTTILTKMGFHHRGYFTKEEADDLEKIGYTIYRKRKLTARCKGQEVEVRRKSAHPHTRPGAYGMEVDGIA